MDDQTDVFFVSDNVLSPIGLTTEENFGNLSRQISGLKLQNNGNLSDEPFFASLFEEGQIAEDKRYTRFESLLIASVDNALEAARELVFDKSTVLIVSSTKGNIGLYEVGGDYESLKDRSALHTSAKLLARHFGFQNPPVVVSSACTSGLIAAITGKRLIQSGVYKHAVIAGCDVISKFILAGFQSLRAISDSPCKPFDKMRNGISLGEGAACLVLSADRKYENGLRIAGGAVSNDANHISGPSRTGLELSFAIDSSIKSSRISADQIDFISAHGTATLYNDEMEAKAITLSGLEKVPVNSLKGYYGHTLGAAGLIETVISARSLKDNVVLPTLGFNESGVSVPVNINRHLERRPLMHCLKTASGFGGVNAAVVISK